jgi:hypothetical protein
VAEWGYSNGRRSLEIYTARQMREDCRGDGDKGADSDRYRTRTNEIGEGGVQKRRHEGKAVGEKRKERGLTRAA